MTFRIVPAFLLLTVLLAACGGSPTAAADSVVNTAVAGTQQAQALAQATVNAVVLTAIPATPTPGPAVEYTSLTEEELAALIDQAVAEAIAATEQTSDAALTTTSDDTMTAEEVVYVYDYYYTAEYYVEYAEQLLDEYYNLYADLAQEMIVELSAIESQLAQMNTTLSSIDTSLQQISSTLEQGLAVAQDSITQLENAATEARASAQELKAGSQDMMSQLQLDQAGRVQDLAQIQPSQVPSDPLSSLQAAFTFVDAAELAMGDSRLSRDELTNLAQLGANAQAGFQTFGGNGGLPGGPDLALFTGNFSEITTQLARGQMPQARGSLDTFERSLGTRPGPGGPGGGPGLPAGGPLGRP